MIFLINIAFMLTILTILLCYIGSIYLIIYMIKKKNAIIKEFEESILNKYNIKKE